MNPGEQLAEALRAASAERALRPPSSDATIGQIEMRFGVRLPKDMTWFYRAMNGMDWPTRPDSGWILDRVMGPQPLADVPAVSERLYWSFHRRRHSSACARTAEQARRTPRRDETR